MTVRRPRDRRQPDRAAPDNRRVALVVGGFALIGLAVLGLVLVAVPREPPPERTLRVLAGSELRDLEPVLADLEREANVRLQLDYVGTLEGADRIAAGEDVDGAWFSHGKYLALLPETAGRIKAQERIMLSPVVMAVKESVADRFGWTPGAAVTWRDIADRSAAGELRYAMTNPTASNSGFTALVGVAAAFAGSADGLDAGEIDVAALTRFFRGQALTAGSSGWLAEAYEREQDRLDGLVNYESVLLSMNASGRLREPLRLVYPREGIVTADYPLMLLAEAKREAYTEAVAWLRSPDVQQRIMKETLRRPAVPGVALEGPFPSDVLIELPFPSTLDVVDQLLFSYLDEQRRPATAIFVLDVSGSMEGDRLARLMDALKGLTGLDPSLVGRFARFRAREEIAMVTFSSGIVDEQRFTIDDTDPNGRDMQEIRAFADGLVALEGTAMYDGLRRGYEIADQARRADPSRYVTLVLRTDGEVNEGITFEEFQAGWEGLDAASREVPTYTVAFGEADVEALTKLAELTGGRAFNATDDLRSVFRTIRGYQ
jgi:Ca-activated chloride channel family protein